MTVDDGVGKRLGNQLLSLNFTMCLKGKALAQMLYFIRIETDIFIQLRLTHYPMPSASPRF